MIKFFSYSFFFFLCFFLYFLLYSYLLLLLLLLPPQSSSCSCCSDVAVAVAAAVAVAVAVANICRGQPAATSATEPEPDVSMNCGSGYVRSCCESIEKSSLYRAGKTTLGCCCLNLLSASMCKIEISLKKIKKINIIKYIYDL